MRKEIIMLSAVALLAAGCTAKKSDAPKLDDVNDSLSWIVGENIARTLPTESFFDIDYDIVVQAIDHTLKGLPQPIDDTTYDSGMQMIMIQTYAMQKKKEKEAQRNVDSMQNEYFRHLLATNKNVKKHPSGFYYEVLREGQGPRATYAMRIRFDYRSFTFDGKPFDQTYGKRDPIIHVVGEPMFNGLIDGFQLMNAGSKYRFYFPYQMLAGNQAAGSVPAFTPLIYEIELYEIYKD